MLSRPVDDGQRRKGFSAIKQQEWSNESNRAASRRWMMAHVSIVERWNPLHRIPTRWLTGVRVIDRSRRLCRQERLDQCTERTERSQD